MPLTTCKKCSKIFSTSEESCPYCGEPKAGNAVVNLSSKQRNIRNAGIAFFVLALLTIVLVQFSLKSDQSNEASSDSGSINNGAADSVSPIKLSCLITECPGGTKGVTFTSQQEPFYSCKSDELSDYANYVLSLMAAQVEFAGVPPDISSKTGEPVVQGKNKLLLDKYRAKAGVSSFEDAISKCYRGKGGVKVVVLFNPEDSNSIYVAAEDNQENKFWLPKARVDKK